VLTLGYRATRLRWLWSWLIVPQSIVFGQGKSDVGRSLFATLLRHVCEERFGTAVAPGYRSDCR
jgi:hypothetical protein